MGIMQTKCSPKAIRQWTRQHPVFVNVDSALFTSAAEMAEIVKWVKNNTDGHSTASIEKNEYKCFLHLYFEDPSDAFKFKMFMT